MPPRYNPFQKEMQSRGGFRGPSGFMHGMSPEKFDAYHGTDQMGLKHIEPSTNHGRSVFSISKQDRTYFMDVSHTNDPETSEHRAWSWAASAAGANGGRPTVYRTRPLGIVNEDTNLVQGEGAYTTDKQRVVDEITTPPPSRFRHYDRDGIRTPIGVQGTVPGVNWMQFGGIQDPMDANATAVWPGKRETQPTDQPTPFRREIPGQRGLPL